MNAIVYSSYLCYSIHKSDSGKSDSPKKKRVKWVWEMKVRGFSPGVANEFSRLPCDKKEQGVNSFMDKNKSIGLCFLLWFFGVYSVYLGKSYDVREYLVTLRYLVDNNAFRIKKCAEAITAKSCRIVSAGPGRLRYSWHPYIMVWMSFLMQHECVKMGRSESCLK